MTDRILIRGAAEHNLKHIDVEIPHGSLTVITGLSGSGKSSLAYDIVFREGQRRFVESLSAYARQYLGRLDRPRVEHIEGLSPTISIDQKTISRNPRSTVGTVTEVLDHLRLFYARLGTPHCPACGDPIASRTVDQIVSTAVLEWTGQEILVCAPIVLERKGEYRKELAELRAQGFARVRVDGQVRRLEEDIRLARYERHSIEVVYDRIVLTPERLSRFSEAVEKALALGDGLIDLVVDERPHLISSRFACARCGISVPELEPRLFSFNSPQGMCPQCVGLGRVLDTDEACAECQGTRLRPEARAVRFRGRGLHEIVALDIRAARVELETLQLSGNEAAIGTPIVSEILHRLRFLERVGLGYLTLARGADSLSGGEAQRIRLASQLGSGLRGVLYVLDEPSVGLHARDNQALLDTLRDLRDLGNTVLVVEHDEETIVAADHVIDIGPGAGVHGGELVAAGPVAAIRACERSRTGRYLAGIERIEVPATRRSPGAGCLTVRGACQHNLQDIDVEFPLGLFTAVTGVSGSGKSTLVDNILYRAARQALGLQGAAPGRHRTVDGLDAIDKVIRIDQSPIGRTPRSNPGTYTKVFDEIRALFARLPEARLRGYAPGRFSFNVKGGRCEACGGAGVITIPMQFLADVEVTCEECNGLRYNPETLAVTYRGRSVHDVLGLTIEEATEFFRDHPRIHRTLSTLRDVGLGYVQLGQPSTTLSGGEAQRVKLADELRRVATGSTLYILDEPTTGLHFDDVRRLLACLQELVDRGNTVIVIEHNLDVVKVTDHVIELGPEGGDGGGRVVATGTPEAVAQCDTPTGEVLQPLLTKRRRAGARARLTRPARRRRVARDPADRFVIVGAREHNLKNLRVEIPRGKLTVITGPSGSGKSTLAFDILFAEGQRRYVESLSTYARRFLGRMQRAQVDRVEGIAPAIAIDQHQRAASPRSTVATTTEIYDYLRLLYARSGIAHCPTCNAELVAWSPSAAARALEEQAANRRCLLLAPLHAERAPRNVLPTPAALAEIATDLLGDGFTRVLIDGAEQRLEDVRPALLTQAREVHLVIDRLAPGKVARSRLAESFEEAYRRAHDQAHVQVEGRREPLIFHRLASCPSGHYARTEELTPRLFSFNHHSGACPACHGLGVARELDPERLFTRKDRPLFEGAMEHTLGTWIGRAKGRVRKVLAKACEEHGIDLERPVGRFGKKALRVILEGTGERVYAVRFRRFAGGRRAGWSRESTWEGLRAVVARWHQRAEGPRWRQVLEEFLAVGPCGACGGGRLRADLLHVRVGGLAIHEISALTIADAASFFRTAQLSERQRTIAHEVLRELENRLSFLLEVGLEYLSLDRLTESLSGGEAQRIRLATQIGNRLVGVLYVLDEPTIGLHQRDNERLLRSLQQLRDLGNSVVVVEHDAQTMELADHIIDLGPGAGLAGGEIVAQGTASEIRRQTRSVTGRYLSGRAGLATPLARRRGDGGVITIRGAAANNLADLDVSFPTGVLTAVTGVSGSGKSSLVMDILAAEIARRLHDKRVLPGRHRSIEGLEALAGAGIIDQAPIGRSPSSNAATYTGMFTALRDLYARLPLARQRGYGPGRFSFNIAGGRCEHCEGKGALLVEMHFLSDVWIPCEVCGGSRYNRETLAVRFKGLTIADVLGLSVDGAREVFADIPPVARWLRVLAEVGLGYLPLGQSGTTLSGGEAQRIKLAAELGRDARGAMLYILDEPTTGLHFVDVEKLVGVLQRLVERGDTVILIEHDLDVIRCADHVIDLGPEGGRGGGQVVAAGTPEEVAACPQSHTGRYLAAALVSRDRQRKKVERCL